MKPQITFPSSEMRQKLNHQHGDWIKHAHSLMSWLEAHGCKRDAVVGIVDGDREYIWTITFPDNDTRLLFKLTWF